MKKIFLCFVALGIMFLVGCSGNNDNDDDSGVINAIAGTWENYYYGTVTFNANKTGHDSYGDNFNWTYKNGTVTIYWDYGDTISFKYSGGDTVVVDGMTFTKIGESEIPADLIGIWEVLKYSGYIVILNSDGTGLLNGFLPGTYTYKVGIISMKTERGTTTLNYNGNTLLCDGDECIKLAEPTTPPANLIGTWEKDYMEPIKFNLNGKGYIGDNPITYEYRNGVIVIKESERKYHVFYYNGTIFTMYKDELDKDDSYGYKKVDG